MRKETINLITIYQLVGSMVNIASMLILFHIEIGIIEAFMTITAVNACYIAVSRDVSRKYELIRSSDSSISHGKAR